MKVLVIEDDARTGEFVRGGLEEQGHTVDLCADGLEGRHLATSAHYDVIVVDRLLPGLNGMSIVRQLRQEEIRTPILILTAVAGVDDRVEGLEAGADDYLVKPFAFSEFMARLNALSRRPPLTATTKRLAIGDLEIDSVRHVVRRAGRDIPLTAQEFKLLEFMAQRAGEVVTRSMMLENLWGFHFDPRTNIVDAHVSRLRAKIDRGFETELIKTIRGAGYILDG